MSIPALAGFGKAAQPLGVAADRFDGLAQEKKRGQAESGTADKVPPSDKRGFRGVSGAVLCCATETTPAQSKPVPRARPMAAKQTVGSGRLPPW